VVRARTPSSRTTIRQRSAPPSIIFHPPWVIDPNIFQFEKLIDGKKSWTSLDWREI
jgi:hypothetical protein